MNKDHDNIIEDLTGANKEAKMVADSLVNELSMSKVIFQEEKSNILKEHSNNVAAWTGDLDYAMTKHNNMVDKYTSLIHYIIRLL